MLTRDRNYEAKGAVIVHDEEELMNESESMIRNKSTLSERERLQDDAFVL